MPVNTLQEITRWLAFAALKETYENNPAALDEAMEVLLADLQFLTSTGIKLQIGDCSITLRTACVGVKGDWPFLIAAGHLERSFRRQPKRGESGMSCPGICHLCLAGRGQYYYSDLSDEPTWEKTIGSAAGICPWDSHAPWHDLPCDDANPPSQFRPDVFHGWHLGAGRYFLASTLVVLQRFEPGGGVDARMESLTRKWLAFCRARRVSWLRRFCEFVCFFPWPNVAYRHVTEERPYFKTISRMSLSWRSSLETPEGTWQKGATTTLLMEPWADDWRQICSVANQKKMPGN